MGIFKPESKDKAKPGGPPTLRQQAMRFVERGEYPKAIAAYESLLPEELDKAAVYNIIGDLYEKLGNAEEAFANYDQAITGYAEEDQFRNAIGVAKKVLRYHKDRIEVYKRLADLYAQEGRVGDAVQALNQYAEQMKDSGSAQILAEIRNTIAQLKEKSLLVQSAVDYGREEGIKKVVAPPPPQPAPAPAAKPVAVDPEEEARRREEERLVRELEEEIERELLAEVEETTAPSAAPAKSPAGEKAPAAVEEAPRPAQPSKSAEEEELEKLIEEAVQASRDLVPKVKEEPGVQESIPLVSEEEAKEEPKAKAAPKGEPVPAKAVPEEAADGVCFLTLSEVEEAEIPEEGSVFSELSSKPYDSELFRSRFDQEVSRSDRYGRPLAFVLVQMAFLKRNSKGKAKKPSPKVALVRKVGDCIRSALRDTDILAYNSDGRIVLILPETPKEGALFVAQRLRSRVGELLTEQDYDDEAERLWLGVIGYPKDARSKEELLRRAQGLMALGEGKTHAGKIVMLPD